MFLFFLQWRPSQFGNEKIQPDLADSDQFRIGNILFQESSEFCKIVFSTPGDIHGMNARRIRTVAAGMRQTGDPSETGTVDRRNDDLTDIHLCRQGCNRFFAPGEFIRLKMTMRIDPHGLQI